MITNISSANRVNIENKILVQVFYVGRNSDMPLSLQQPVLSHFL